MQNITDNQPPHATYTVVIPAWNEARHIQSTLDALHDAQADLAYQGDIVVVDNNSSDDTADIARSLEATVVFEPINQIARARNAGATVTDSDFLIFLDADTTVNSVLLNLTLDAMHRGDVIGGGSTVAFDRDLAGFAKWLVSFWNWFSTRFKAAAGCYIFCTREAFDNVGGFDEKQYAAEELHLSRALRKLARSRSQKFVIFNQAPVISSARKLDWYSSHQKLKQLALLLLPGSTRSKAKCGMWYDRSNITENKSTYNK